MIPITLTLKGFLSYKNEVMLDLSPVEVACISGANGAGKSSLFDAMTWVLFGKARRSDDALINDAAETCSVIMEFEYENNRYRVQREKPRGRGVMLEFQILSADSGWRPLTEAGLRATEDRIRDVLRLDYETFVNASFFLQGKADMFTQQPPARRKEILSSILGLEVWESYREEAAQRRRSANEEAKGLRAWLDEVVEELGQEAERQERLKLLSDNLQTTSALREEKEHKFADAQKQAQALLLEEDKLNIILKGLEGAQKRLEETKVRISVRSDELETCEKTLSLASEIEKKHMKWETLRKELERWNQLAGKHHTLRSERAELDALVRAEAAQIQQEMEGLKIARAEVVEIESRLPELQRQQEELISQQKEIIAELDNLPELEEEFSVAQKRDGELSAQNKTLRDQMNDLKEHIEELKGAEGSECPLCGQKLSEQHQKDILADYQDKGKTLGDNYRVNEKTRQDLAQDILSVERRITELRQLREKTEELGRKAGGLTAQIEAMQTRITRWEQKEEPRLAAVEKLLKQEAFASQERLRISKLDTELKSLGYDEEAHTKNRSDEAEARGVELEFRTLEKARTAGEGLRRELSSLNESRSSIEEEVISQTLVYESTQKDLSMKTELLPDMASLETDLDAARMEENRLRSEVGGARQMVDVLETQRKRQAELNAQIETLNCQVSQFKMLETAFGKDGVPALLIEQALPEIETQANELLDRLSDGRMSVSFETEREYKDKKREDKRQTLDILISDSSGRREYELFSGGEAFRIDFAIRLALSRVLAGRAGARLQTLVIDEGFGSQDAEGRQRLIEAIYLVSRDFAKILVITHLDELKDAFPSRIEVTKTDGGSRVEVIA